MSRPDTSTLTLAGCIAVCVLGATAGPAAATMDLHMPEQADAGKPVPFTYSAARSGGKVKVVLERLIGDGPYFTGYRTLRVTRRGRGVLPARKLGAYEYRAVLYLNGRSREASAPATVQVFDDVPVGTFLHAVGPEVHPGAAGPFTYTATRTGNAARVLPVVKLKAAENTCRSARLTWLSGDYRAAGPTGQATLQAASGTDDPVSASSAPEVPSTLTSKLVPGRSWTVRYRSAASPDTSRLFLDGTLSCYTTGLTR